MLESGAKITVPRLLEMKARSEKIAVLTAYDATFAAVLDRAGVDVILVGDSLGMVVQGKPTTLPVSLDDVIYHSRCVARGVERAFIVADLPFMTYATPAAAAENAARLFREAGVGMVKLEGGRVRTDIVRFLVAQNMPVCGHLGLLPQSIHALGGYHMQAGDDESAAVLMQDAMSLQEAGASLLVLECIPATLAGEISGALQIPVIGIGAGVNCDGQVLVLHDLLGLGHGRRPRFVKDFLAETGSIAGAIGAYVQDVKSGRYPAPEHSY